MSFLFHICNYCILHWFNDYAIGLTLWITLTSPSLSHLLPSSSTKTNKLDDPLPLFNQSSFGSLHSKGGFGLISNNPGDRRWCAWTSSPPSSWSSSASASRRRTYGKEMRKLKRKTFKFSKLLLIDEHICHWSHRLWLCDFVFCFNCIISHGLRDFEKEMRSRSDGSTFCTYPTYLGFFANLPLTNLDV